MQQVHNQFPGQRRFHLALNVTDIEKSVAFYEHVFGQKPAKVRNDYAKFDVADPSVNFTLNLKTPGAGPDRLSHMGVQLSDEATLASIKTRVEGAGLLKYTEEQTDCCYARQDKFWMEDPDGNMVEFFVVFADVEANNPPKQACCG